MNEHSMQDSRISRRRQELESLDNDGLKALVHRLDTVIRYEEQGQNYWRDKCHQNTRQLINYQRVIVAIVLVAIVCLMTGLVKVAFN